jgi:hypothetical protein
MNNKTKAHVNKPPNSLITKPSTTQSENEQLLIYADIISNFIIKEIIKADEKRKHHSC